MNNLRSFGVYSLSLSLARALFVYVIVSLASNLADTLRRILFRAVRPITTHIGILSEMSKHTRAFIARFAITRSLRISFALYSPLSLFLSLFSVSSSSQKLLSPYLHLVFLLSRISPLLGMAEDR